MKPAFLELFARFDDVHANVKFWLSRQKLRISAKNPLTIQWNLNTLNWTNLKVKIGMGIQLILCLSLKHFEIQWMPIPSCKRWQS